MKYVAEQFPASANEGGGDGWLRDGAEYRVLEVSVGTGRPAALRIAADDGTPALFDARAFELVDGQLPSTWRASLNAGYLTLGPPDFQAPGFWEAFFDGAPEAEEAYKRVLGSS